MKWRGMFANAQNLPLAGRIVMLFVGLLLYGVAIKMNLHANVGVPPWEVLHTGINRVLGWPLGMVILVFGLIVVGFSHFVLREPVGIGTVLNGVMIGLVVEALDLPELSLPMRWASFFFSILLLGFATGFYVSAKMGAGPRDGLVIGMARVINKPVAAVRVGIELSVIAIGMLMGGAAGLGTLLFALLAGPAMSFGLELFGISKKKS